MAAAAVTVHVPSRMQLLLHKALQEVELVRQLLALQEAPSAYNSSLGPGHPCSPHAAYQAQGSPAHVSATPVVTNASASSPPVAASNASNPSCQLHWTPIGVPRDLRTSTANAAAADCSESALPLSGLRRINTTAAAAAPRQPQLLTTSCASPSSSTSSELFPEIDTAGISAVEADEATHSALLDTGRFSAFSNDLFAADDTEDVPNLGTPTVAFAGFNAAGGSARAAAAAATAAMNGGWGTPATEWGSFVSGGTPASVLPMQLFAVGNAPAPMAGALAATPQAAAAAGLPVTPGVWGSAAPSAAPSTANRHNHILRGDDATPLRSLGDALAACAPLTTTATATTASTACHTPGEDFSDDLAPPASDQDMAPSPCAPAPIPSHSPRVGPVGPKTAGNIAVGGASSGLGVGRGTWQAGGLVRSSATQAAAGKAVLRSSAGGSGSAKASVAAKRIEPFATIRSSLDSAAAAAVKRISGVVGMASSSSKGSGSRTKDVRLSLGPLDLKENIPPSAPVPMGPSALARKSMPMGSVRRPGSPGREVVAAKGQQAPAGTLRGFDVRASAPGLPVAKQGANKVATRSRLPTWDAALGERVNGSDAARAVDSPGQVLKGVLRAQAQSIAVFGGPSGELHGLGVSPLVGMGRR